MNHGLINLLYYPESKKQAKTLYLSHPVYIKFNAYFKRYKGRDKYYIAMKYHAIQIMLKLELTSEQMKECFDLKSHSTILNIKNKYEKKRHHDSFIAENFDNYVENFIYPLAVRSHNWAIERKYNYKPTIINKNGEKQ